MCRRVVWTTNTAGWTRKRAFCHHLLRGRRRSGFFCCCCCLGPCRYMGAHVHGFFLKSLLLYESMIRKNCIVGDLKDFSFLSIDYVCDAHVSWYLPSYILFNVRKLWCLHSAIPTTILIRNHDDYCWCSDWSSWISTYLIANHSNFFISCLALFIYLFFCRKIKKEIRQIIIIQYFPTRCEFYWGFK